MAKFPLIGPGYTLASVAADSQRCVNWYPEVDELGTGRSQMVLKRRPGLALFANLGSGTNAEGFQNRIRGIWAGENRLFAVCGAQFFEVFSDGTSNNRGFVGDDGGNCRILTNGDQILISSAGNVYCDNGSGPAQVFFSTGGGNVNTGPSYTGTVDVGDLGGGLSTVNQDTGPEFPLNITAIDINGTVYGVLPGSVTETSLTIQADLAVLGATWTATQTVTGFCSVTQRVGYSTATVAWDSGPLFPAGLQFIAIAGINYSVSVYTSGTLLTIGVPIDGALALTDVAWTGADNSTNGVQWVSGDEFVDDDLAAGQQMMIDGVIYVIQSVLDETDLLLTTNAGVQSNVPWTFWAFNGVVEVLHIPLAGQAVIGWVSGDLFSAGTGPPVLQPGNPIVIAGISYTVASVTSSTQLIIDGNPDPGFTNAQLNYGANSPVPAFQATYLDGYAAVCQPSSANVFLSALFDFTTFDPSVVEVKSSYPDNIAAMLADHQQLILWGTENSSEVWQDVGAVDFPFQRNAAENIHWGCQVPWSVCRFQNGVAFIGGDQERGSPVAWYAESPRPTRISTHAIEQVWAGYTQISDGIAYSKVEDGHQLLVYSFPTADACWVYDGTASAQLGVPCWHERLWWDGTLTSGQPNLHRDRASFHAFLVLATAGKTPVQCVPQHYLGDWNNGNIYTAAPGNVTDNGVAIQRIRTSPHVNTAPLTPMGTFSQPAWDNLRTEWTRTEVLIDLGPAVGSPPAPLSVSPTLDYSKDGGHTYVNPQQITTSPGLTDIYQSRFVWRRQGASRDRILRLEMSDASQFTVIDAFYEGFSEMGPRK